MNRMQRIVITLIICFCLALPAAAQKNIKALQRALTCLDQYAQGTAAQTLPLTVKTLKIINLPNRPSVQVLLDTPPVPHTKSSIRLIPPRQVRTLLYQPDERKVFLPRDFVTQTKALYRGMAIEDMDELKNILINGLETNKSNFGEKIFTAYDPLTAVLYAQPTHRFNTKANLPILVKIPLTPDLEQYAPKHFETAEAFQKNIPANAISDVWILLEVNKKANWYKATLENGKIVLFPAHARLQKAR